ncbi:MAG TPA: N-acetylmuramoyl-L-alanine amidase [Deinococcales bacterium]|nr:N-acetylmuramoyl-L-alanine amidase [Deinococcales bacterium]
MNRWRAVPLALLALAAVVPALAAGLPALPAPRVGIHPGFTRVVLDLPEGATETVTPAGWSLVVRVTGVSATALSSTAGRPELSTLDVLPADGGATVTLGAPQGVSARSGWRSSLLPMADGTPGQRLVLDLSGAYTDASAPGDLPAFPFANSSGTGWKVVIDPGHGGSDPGALGFAREADVNLSIALLVADDLRAQGVTVVMTREADSGFSPDETTDLASRTVFGQGASAFVSIHANAAPSASAETAYGPEVYAYGPDGGILPALPLVDLADPTPLSPQAPSNFTFAERVMAALGGAIGTRGRGPRTANYYVLRNARCPAILVETGFVTHPVEGEALTEPDYQARLAAGIAWGILQYLDTDLAANA